MSKAEAHSRDQRGCPSANVVAERSFSDHVIAAGLDRVVIIDDYSAARGGATTLSLLSARLLRDLRIPVTYICGDDGANAELRALGVTIVALGGRDLLNAKRITAAFTGIHNVNAARMIAAWVRANDTPNTAYHVHGWSKILSPAIFSSLAPVASRCVVHAHDFFTACPNGAYFDYQAQRICPHRPLGVACLATACDKRSYPQKLWRVVRGANVQRLLRGQEKFGRIVLLHEKMQSYFLRAGYPASRTKTIRNPVAFLSSERVKAEDNDEFFFIGRLDEEKGIEDAVAATKRARARLCVIGDGPLMGKVSASGSHVRTLGWLSHAEISQAIRKARALVMPSRYPEPFGLVAIEAARSGVPVILSKDAFLTDEMTGAGIALCCDTGDEEAFSHALVRFLEMPKDEVRQMSERAFRSSSRLALTNDEWRDALLAEYRVLISQGTPTASIRTPLEGVFA